jgi:hypothetical protein
MSAWGELLAGLATASAERASMDGRRKDKSLAFYDEFYAMPLSEQKIALRILSEHHRAEQIRADREAKAKADGSGNKENE